MRKVPETDTLYTSIRKIQNRVLQIEFGIITTIGGHVVRRNGDYMSDHNYPIITIGREFGAGGRSVAKAVSQRLNIPYFDKDFVKQTAAHSGYSVEDVEREGEHLRRSSKLLNNILNNAASYQSSHDAIFNAQRELILKLAEQDCIIIGRCSNIILREAGIPTLDIFLCANLDDRIRHVEELGLNGNEDAQKCVTRTDGLRATYYKTYTKHTLGDYHDYHLILDTSLVGYDRCVDLIVDLAQHYKMPSTPKSV